MAYQIGDEIAASHYNTFATTVNKTFAVGTGNQGYGASTIAPVAVGARIFSVEWMTLRNAIDDCNVHQGINVSAAASATAIPASADFEIGETILAYSGSSGRWNLERNASAIFVNRLDLAASQTTLTGDVNVSFRSTPWNTQLIHEFSVTFDTTEDARLFFNKGGKLHVSGRRVGGSASLQNQEWTNMLDDNSPYIFDSSAYFQGAQTSLKTRRVVTGSAAAYTANEWVIKEKRDAINTALGSQGKEITFQIEFNDDQPFGSAAHDTVDGSIVSSIDRIASVGRFISASPIFTTITELTAGS